MQTSITVCLIVAGIFLLFCTIRGSYIVGWRSEVRNAVTNYNNQFIKDVTSFKEFNNYLNNKIDSEEVLLSFNDCWNKFWLFGKYSMMQKEYIEILKPYFND